MSSLKTEETTVQFQNMLDISLIGQDFQLNKLKEELSQVKYQLEQKIRIYNICRNNKDALEEQNKLLRNKLQQQQLKLKVVQTSLKTKEKQSKISGQQNEQPFSDDLQNKLLQAEQKLYLQRKRNNQLEEIIQKLELHKHTQKTIKYQKQDSELKQKMETVLRENKELKNRITERRELQGPKNQKTTTSSRSSQDLVSEKKKNDIDDQSFDQNLHFMRKFEQQSHILSLSKYLNSLQYEQQTDFLNLLMGWSQTIYERNEILRLSEVDEE